MLLQEQRQTRYRQWRQNPDTEQFFKELHMMREEIKENWAQRSFIGDTPDEMYAKNASALGEVRILDDLLKKEQFDE